MNNLISTSDFLEYLLTQKSPALAPEEMSRIVDQLVWYVADNGREIRDVLSAWIVSDSLRKVEVALYIDSHFPCDSRHELVHTCNLISSKWPHLKSRCETILAAWDTQFPKER